MKLGMTEKKSKGQNFTVETWKGPKSVVKKAALSAQKFTQSPREGASSVHCPSAEVSQSSSSSSAKCYHSSVAHRMWEVISSEGTRGRDRDGGNLGELRRETAESITANIAVRHERTFRKIPAEARYFPRKEITFVGG